MHTQYRTPKRRHSSLFQRMEEQIQKISKKLSAVKASNRHYSNEKINSTRKDTSKQYKDKHFQQKEKAKTNTFQAKNYQQIRKNIRFDSFHEPSVIETVRIKPSSQNYNENCPFSGKKTLTSKTLKRRQNIVSYRQNNEQKVMKLQQQNQELSMQIKRLEAVCADQSYRLGYASAYFEDKCKRLEEEKQSCQKENIYLQKLCEHYKSKSKKYKQNLREFSNQRISQSSYEP